MKPLFEPEPPIHVSRVSKAVEIMNRTKNVDESSTRTIKRRVGSADVVFLDSDFSLVCETNGKASKSVVSKLTALFESNEQSVVSEREHNSLFYPEAKKSVIQQAKSLFGFGDQGDQGEATPKFSALEDIAKKSSAITFIDTSPLKPEKHKDTLPVIQSFYRNHKLNEGKSEAFVLLVQTIDSKINLDSAITIIKYGAGIQDAIGKFLTDASGYGSQLTTIGLAQRSEQIVELMGSLAIDKFSGKKKTGFFSSTDYTINDFIEKFKEVESKLDVLLPEVVNQSINIVSMMGKCESMVDEHARLVDELDAHIIAGKIVIERNKAKVFKDHNEQFLNDQFEKRLVDMMTYENLCVVSFEQVKLVQRQLLDMATHIQVVATVMYPLWRTSMSTLFSQWQSSGKMKKETSISSLTSDAEFMSMAKQTETIIHTINQKG